jgi:hypothetical protein
MYGLVNEQFDDLPAPVIGMMLGVALWAVSFEGWMPALGVQEATTENPKKWPLSIMATWSTAPAWDSLMMRSTTCSDTV